MLYSGGVAQERSTRLAPLYDLLSTVYYPQLATKMAMKIGGEYASDNVRPLHFEKLAGEAGLSKALVRQRVPQIGETLLAALEGAAHEHPVALAVAELIKSRTERVLMMFKKQG